MFDCRLIVIPVWIYDHMPSNVWVEITCYSQARTVVLAELIVFAESNDKKALNKRVTNIYMHMFQLSAIDLLSRYIWNSMVTIVIKPEV